MGRLFFMLICSFFISSTLAFGMAGAEAVDKLSKENNVKEVGFEYVLSKIGDGRLGHTEALILDARPQKRYDASHIPGAIMFPDTQVDENMKELKGIAKNKEIITYCQGPKCEKSVQLAIDLEDKGYTNVKVYRGGIPDWEKKFYVDIGLKTAKAMYDKNAALFIDTRPFLKFKKGSIIGALNILDTQFNELWGRLPTDTKTPVVTFCGGYECEKSHVVARNMSIMGYENVFTMSAGFPGWVTAGYETTAASGDSSADADAPKKKVGPLTLGADEGTVDVDAFKVMIEDLPKNVQIIDVRAKEDYKSGHIPGAINYPKADHSLEQFEKKVSNGKYTIFTCSTGTRALEMWVDFKSKLNYPEMDKIYYLDAKVDCKGQECEIEGYEALF
ncbi:MAG: rhodanese-like domain-containing protein [Campylobacterales bacterium]